MRGRVGDHEKGLPAEWVFVGEVNVLQDGSGESRFKFVRRLEGGLVIAHFTFCNCNYPM